MQGDAFPEALAFLLLGLLALVEGFHGAEVAHHARPHFALHRFPFGFQLLGGLLDGLAGGFGGAGGGYFGVVVGLALGAVLVFAGDVAVLGADGEGGGDGDVGDVEGGEAAPDEFAAGLGVAHALAHVEVEDGAAGVHGLEVFLLFEGFEGVVGVADGEHGRVGVVGGVLEAGLQDVGEALLVFAGEAVAGAFGGGGLQVVEVAGFFLEVDEAGTHVVEQLHGHFVAGGGGDVLFVVGEVAHHFVDAVDADGGEVVVEASEVALGVGVEAAVDEFVNLDAFLFQGVFAEFHQFVDAGEEAFPVAFVLVAEAGAVEGDDADGAGLFGGSEEAVAALQQFAEVELEAAAHGADHSGVQVGVDEVLEVGQAVFGGHLEEGLHDGSFPVEVFADVVGGDGEGEDAAVSVTFCHDLDEGPVDEGHFLVEVAVGEVDGFAADEGDLRGKVGGALEVEGEVGEGGLGAPAAGDVEVEDEFLHLLLDVLVAEVVEADEGGHVGVEGAEGLRTGPFVLEGSEEVDDLTAGGGEVLGWEGGDGAGDAVEAFFEELAEGPAGAVAGEHVEVVDVDGAVAVGFAGGGAVDVAEPVVGDDLTGGVEHHAAQGVVLVGVGVDAPVAAVEVFVDGGGDVDDGPGGGVGVRHGGVLLSPAVSHLRGPTPEFSKGALTFRVGAHV